MDDAVTALLNAEVERVIRNARQVAEAARFGNVEQRAARDELRRVTEEGDDD